MSAIARLWFKWVNDETKPYTIDDVPVFWKEEVQVLIDEATTKKEGEEDSKDTRGDGQNY